MSANVQRLRKHLSVTFLSILFTTAAFGAPTWLDSVSKGPSVLVLYDGPDIESNPGRLDANYLANLLGHFTAHRSVRSLDAYTPGELKAFDVVFTIVYQKKYRVPQNFLNDVATGGKPFCWLGNQVGQLNRVGMLERHGLRFDRFFENSPARNVIYKSRTLVKGDPDINLLKIVDSAKVNVLANATGANGWTAPYILRDRDFWIVTDSPFSYSSENDRYLAFADVLHDILGVNHPEGHSALLRLEDLNPMSDPEQLNAMLRVIRSNRIPFSFGMVPFYVNPAQHLFEPMGERPLVVQALKDMVDAGGSPVLHGDTHQYRGVTTDDYEFWDNIADRAVKRDSDPYVVRKLEDALKECVLTELYPVTWETPHYAASALDYHVFKRFFGTTYERRLTSNRLGSDQFFPYPVIDMTGQFVIPESLGYVQIENPRVEPLLANAEAALVVRDGYASFFFHPFLKPQLLNTLINGIENMGYKFVSLAEFPNRVQHKGYLTTNVNGDYTLGGDGRYVTEIVRSKKGGVLSQKTKEVSPKDRVQLKVVLRPGETYVAYRHAVRAPNLVERLFRLAKGDLSVINQRWENLFASEEFPEDRTVALFWNDAAKGDEAIDQKSFDTMLQVVGYEVNRVSIRSIQDQEIGKFSLLVIPAASARHLGAKDVEAIYRAVEAGIVLVTDGESALSKALGFEMGHDIRVNFVQNHLFPTQELRWPDTPSVPWIAHVSDENDVVLFSEREDQRPLVVNRSLGEGRVLFFAPYFDALSGEGYSRFPDVPYLLVNEFRVRPILRRAAAEAYFDPGYRQNISVEQLGRYWRKYGIRVIHVAAWHFYDKYSYDYERLIRVAHQNGILVYAWFEWPHVSQKFWNQHPEWREKNALLADAHLDWRYLMNFQNPKCFEAVVGDAKLLLSKLDWDGVNLAEFHFEAGSSPQDASKFTPLNNESRALFEKEYGFDPLELWKNGSPNSLTTNDAALQKFYAFRKDQNHILFRKIARELQQVRNDKSKSLEFVVTMFDVFGHPQLSNRLAIDGPRTLDVINTMHATLQVEDPAVEWSKTPDRYARLGERYRAMNLKNPFMIDINVLDVHPSNQPGFATAVQSGTELLQLWQAASKYARRVCLYSESTISESDWELLPYTMAADASVNRDGDNWIVNSEDSVILELTRPFKRVFVDDRPWFCVTGQSILLPAGEHRVSLQPNLRSWLDTTQLETRLLSLSGELLGSEPRKHGLEVEYRSTGRAALLFNKQPLFTYVDDESIKLPTIKGQDGFVVLAPAGQHRLRIVTESNFLFFLNYTSMVSASLIVIFGVASSGLLLLAFVAIKISRKTRPMRRKFRQTLSKGPIKKS